MFSKRRVFRVVLIYDSWSARLLNENRQAASRSTWRSCSSRLTRLLLCPRGRAFLLDALQQNHRVLRQLSKWHMVEQLATCMSQELDRKADVVADALAAMQQEEAAKAAALDEAARLQAALQRAQVRTSPHKRRMRPRPLALSLSVTMSQYVRQEHRLRLHACWARCDASRGVWWCTLLPCEVVYVLLSCCVNIRDTKRFCICQGSAGCTAAGLRELVVTASVSQLSTPAMYSLPVTFRLLAVLRGSFDNGCSAHPQKMYA